MYRMLIGMLIGITLASLFFWGQLVPTPVTAESDSPAPTENTTDNITEYREDIRQMLQEAGNGIQDEATSQFYYTLIEEYRLDEQPSATEPDEEPDLEQVLPDIQRISNTAIVLPLQEVGKDIKDEQIAQFYYRFLDNVGWSIERN